MKKYFLSFSAITILGMAYSLFNNQANLYSGSTGAPGAGSCAVSGCHGGTLQSSNDITLELLDENQLPVTSYVAEKTYEVKISVNGFSNPKFGFALSANGGTLSESSAAIQKINQYLTHTSSGTAADAGGGKVWTASWTAPSSGNVNFQLYVNATNGNNASTGDVIYSKALSVTSAATGINELLTAGSLSVYPVPASGLVNMDFELKQTSEVSISVLSAEGKLVKTLVNKQLNSGKQHVEFSEELSSGLYFMHIAINGQSAMRKLVIE